MHDPDHQIIRRVLAGDPNRFAELVDRHKGHGFTMAMRMLKHREDAEEALQDAFVRAYRALGRFEFNAKFSTWFYRILFNVCATALAQRKGVREISIDDDPDDAAPLQLPSPDAPPDVDLESREFHTIVADEIAKLPPHYGAILSLFLLEDLSYNEIVEITSMPLGTVKTQLFRARMLLRNAVAARMNERGRKENTLA